MNWVPRRPRVFRGIGASWGVTLGRVFLLDRGVVREPHYDVDATQVATEQARMQAAIDLSVAQLHGARNSVVAGGDVGPLSILEAHEMMLRDPSWVAEVQGRIAKERINAEWALSLVTQRLRQALESTDDPYLRERGGDVGFLAERVLRNLAGGHAELRLLLPDATAAAPCVVVARNLSPVDAALLGRYQVAAFVTELGGKTSHVAIMARSLEVPAVVAARGVFEAAGNDDAIVIDGGEGSVVLRPSPDQLARGARRAAAHARRTREVLAAKALPAQTRDGRTLTLLGNVEQPGEVETILGRGGEGIGLYRTEFMFTDRTQMPTAEDHYQDVKGMLARLDGRPLTVRTLDLGGDKLLGPLAYATESNPALGLRAIRFCLHHREVFRAQVAGLLRAAVHGNLRIMLPMISGVDELREVRAFFAEVAAELQQSGVAHRADVPLGIMVEIPSAALCAADLAAECAFFSVGTNDLLQYLLAVDRGNERVAHMYRPLHPAALRLLVSVVRAAEAAGIPLSVCGEMAGDVELVPILLGMGVRALSMQASSLPHVKRRVRGLQYDACVALLQRACACVTPQEVEREVKEFLAAVDQEGAAVLQAAAGR